MQNSSPNYTEKNYDMINEYELDDYWLVKKKRTLKTKK